jgi:hypothetical protein
MSNLDADAVRAIEVSSSEFPVDRQLASIREIASQLVEKVEDITAMPADTRRALLSLISAENTSAETSARKAIVAEVVVRVLILNAGGVFIGKEELVKLGKSVPDAVVTELPAKYSEAFFRASHPIRGVEIARNAILGFDTVTNQWYCFEKTIIPNSTGISGDEQDKLVRNIEGSQLEVEGVKMSSPSDSEPVQRVLDTAIAFHLKHGGSIEDVPLADIWARTADTKNGYEPDCRVLLGRSDKNGSCKLTSAPANTGHTRIGLLVDWS